MANVLYCDIETAPKLAYVWQFFKAFISPKQVKEHGHIMSFSGIWNDDADEDILYFENRTQDDTKLVKQMIKLLDKADMVVGHNVEYFDVATINARALVLGIKPPSPYKIVDTYKAAKRYFKFESNSLEYLTKVLKVAHKKLTHAKFPGFELWLACIAGNKEAWKEMKEYNINDTLAVRDVYMEMRPWIRNHPNMAVFGESEEIECNVCGSVHLHKRGFAYTNFGKYQQYQCQECGHWLRTRFSERDKTSNKSLLTNA